VPTAGQRDVGGAAVGELAVSELELVRQVEDRAGCADAARQHLGVRVGTLELSVGVGQHLGEERVVADTFEVSGAVDT
jgi:hypothetical protein